MTLASSVARAASVADVAAGVAEVDDLRAGGVDERGGRGDADVVLAALDAAGHADAEHQQDADDERRTAQRRRRGRGSATARAGRRRTSIRRPLVGIGSHPTNAARAYALPRKRGNRRATLFGEWIPTPGRSSLCGPRRRWPNDRACSRRSRRRSRSPSGPAAPGVAADALLAIVPDPRAEVPRRRAGPAAGARRGVRGRDAGRGRAARRATRRSTPRVRGIVLADRLRRAARAGGGRRACSPPPPPARSGRARAAPRPSTPCARRSPSSPRTRSSTRCSPGARRRRRARPVPARGLRAAPAGARRRCAPRSCSTIPTCAGRATATSTTGGWPTTPTRTATTRRWR